MSALPWFKLPEEDEKILQDLIERYGVGRILAVLSRAQVTLDKKARDAGEILRNLSAEELGL